MHKICFSFKHNRETDVLGLLGSEVKNSQHPRSKLEHLCGECYTLYTARLLLSRLDATNSATPPKSFSLAFFCPPIRACILVNEEVEPYSRTCRSYGAEQARDELR